MTIDWYFDFISPFAYLQWQRLRDHAEIKLRPRPILFAVILDHLQHKGPAEIPEKRRFAYRFVHHLAGQRGIPLRFPVAHPFNPLAALRLATACDGDRDVVDAVFHQIWGEGGSTDDFAQISRTYADRMVLDAQQAKDRLRDNTQDALGRGVFGVPTLDIHGSLFWGDDASDLALDVLRHPDLLQQGDYPRLDALPQAVTRKAAQLAK